MLVFLCFHCIDYIIFLKILADAMGLGKTIMTISLLLHSGKVVSSGGASVSQNCSVEEKTGDFSEQRSSSLKDATKVSGFVNLMKQKKLIVGGTLIICPMTLLGQWKVFFCLLKFSLPPSLFSFLSLCCFVMLKYLNFCLFNYRPSTIFLSVSS